VPYSAHVTTRTDAPSEGAWSSEYLASIIDSSDDAIIGKTLDAVITSWNKGAQRIYGYTADEVIGRPISILIPPERPDELPAIMEKLRRGERIEHYQTERVRKDGARLSISVTISPILDSAGEVVGASAIARDITAQDRAVREALALREQFISVAAHELRTPLTAIIARVQLVERRLNDPRYGHDAIARDISAMRRGADKLRVLLERLLDISRIRSGQLALERAPTDLAALVRAVATDYAEASGRLVNVFVDAPENDLVEIDAVRLEEALLNLIDNAAKYGPPNTPIDVSVAATRNTVRIAVRDQGAGIPPEKREELFEAFSRGQTDARGVGLGLYLVREICQLHGGKVVIEDGEGRGTTFVITLPR
jgi:PAS domain S-box-containing protein